MRVWLKSWLIALCEKTNNLSKSQKGLSAIALVLLLGFVVSFAFRANATNWVQITLVYELELAEQIQSVLDEAGIDNRLAEQGELFMLEIPEIAADRAIVTLATAPSLSLPRHNLHYTLSDTMADSGMGITASIQHAMLTAELQDSLSDKISQLPNIESAVVTLLIPNADPMLAPIVDLVRAFVTIAVSQDFTHTDEEAIVHILLDTLEGLSVENVDVLVIDAIANSDIGMTDSMQHAMLTAELQDGLSDKISQLPNIESAVVTLSIPNVDPMLAPVADLVRAFVTVSVSHDFSYTDEEAIVHILLDAVGGLDAENVNMQQTIITESCLQDALSYKILQIPSIESAVVTISHTIADPTIFSPMADPMAAAVGIIYRGDFTHTDEETIAHILADAIAGLNVEHVTVLAMDAEAEFGRGVTAASMQHAMFIAGLQDSLSDEISQMPNIESAVVTLSIPNADPMLAPIADPAHAFVSVVATQDLTYEGKEAIGFLLAEAVEGLNAENVMISLPIEGIKSIVEIIEIERAVVYMHDEVELCIGEDAIFTEEEEVS